MDLRELKIQFLQGYEAQRPLPDGYIQMNKCLPYFSVVYPLEGYYELSVEDGERITVPPDGCFLVPPNVRHTLVHRSETGFLLDRWLFFSVMYRNILDVTAWFRPPLFLSGEAAAPFKAAVDGLLTLPQEPHAEAFGKLRIAGQLLEALFACSEFRSAKLGMEPVLPAVELIRTQFSGRLTVEDLAKACGMSVSAFHRAFRKLTQKTPQQYLSSYRLQQAAGLILQKQMSLSQIAAACGFCDEFHLSNSFKRGYGVSPRQYRASARL